jgi:hypothetical protein
VAARLSLLLEEIAVVLFGAFGAHLTTLGKFQRLDRKGGKELTTLPEAEIQIYIALFLGGFFGAVSYLLLASGAVTGKMLPTFAGADTPFENLAQVLHTAEPATVKDALLVLFWAWVAGYSERFVVSLRRTTRYFATTLRQASSSRLKHPGFDAFSFASSRMVVASATVANGRRLKKLRSSAISCG